MKRRELCSTLLHCVFDRVRVSSSRRLAFESTSTPKHKLTTPLPVLFEDVGGSPCMHEYACALASNVT